MTLSPFKLPKGKNPDLSDISKALVVVAHPDDIDYGGAGTIAHLTANNIEVSYCMVTSGEAGGDRDKTSNQERMEVRENEQRKAAKKVGVEKLHFLRQPDGQIEANLGLREKITRVIRTEKPDLVITQSPQRRYDRIFASHPDHLATGEATVSACYPDAQNPHAFSHLLDESLEPHQIKAIWLMAEEHNDTYIDISNYVENKIDALLSHESQISDTEAVTKMVKQWTNATAIEAGFGPNAYAESFKFIQILH